MFHPVLSKVNGDAIFACVVERSGKVEVWSHYIQARLQITVMIHDSDPNNTYVFVYTHNSRGP